MVDIRTIERRFRYRLGLRGWKLHKQRGGNGEPVYYITDGMHSAHDEQPNDDAWMTFVEVGALCEELALEDAQKRSE